MQKNVIHLMQHASNSSHSYLEQVPLENFRIRIFKNLSQEQISKQHVIKTNKLKN